MHGAVGKYVLQFTRPDGKTGATLRTILVSIELKGDIEMRRDVELGREPPFIDGHEHENHSCTISHCARRGQGVRRNFGFGCHDGPYSEVWREGSFPRQPMVSKPHSK
jgi:hypothetical protein